MTRPHTLLPSSDGIARPQWTDQKTTALVVIVSVGLVAAIAAVTVSYSPIASVLVIGLAAAVFVPRAVFALSLAWILLIRPGYELVHSTVVGVAVTETDVLPLLAAVAAIALRAGPGAARGKVHLGSVLLLLAYPIWLLVRFIVLPTTSAIHLSPVVDYRNITMFSVVVPLIIYMNKRGFDSLFRTLMNVAYLASVIAIGAWVLLMTGLLRPANTAFVYFHSASDVRPGGEILVVVLAVMLLVGKAPLLLRSKALSLFVVAGEFLVSQTLSMVVAVVAGVLVYTVFRRDGRTLKRLGGALVVVGLFAGLAIGGLAAGSRFDLGERLGESSAQYRATEFNRLSAVVSSSNLTLLAGAGAGSAIAVPNVYTGAIDIKRDTHNAYGNVALKGGLIALALFIGPLLLSTWALLRRRQTQSTVLAAALVAILVLNITVPFVWTAPGLTALVALLLGTLSFPLRSATGELEVQTRRAELVVARNVGRS